MARSSRLGEYFIVVGAGDQLVPIAGQTSTNPLEISFQGEVLDRYPLASSSEGLAEFPPGVAMFCLPNGLRFSAQPEMPIFYSFASTVASGDKLYGACLKFYEEVSAATVDKAKRAVTEMHLEIPSPSDKASMSIRSPSDSADEDLNGFVHAAGADHGSSESGSLNSADQGDEVFFDVEEPPANAKPDGIDELQETWFAPKCICILSTWPFFGPLRTFLTQLYRISLTPTTIPLERHLVNFLREVPVPPRGSVNVQFTIADQTVCLSRPALNDPLNESVSGFDMIELFELLPVETVITVLECLLLERKVVFVSSQYSLLMSVAESFLLLMYPFRWQHVYIPLLPEALLDFLNAPMPLLIGTHYSFLHSYTDISDSIVLINIDTQTIHVPGKPPRIPEHERTKLLSALKSVSAYQNSLRGVKPHSASVSPVSTPTSADSHQEVKEAPHEPFSSQQWIDADLAFTNVPPPDHIDNTPKHLKIGMDSKAIRQAFFRVYVSILKNYRDFIVYPNEEDPYPVSFFRTEDFIETFPNSAHRFLNGFLSTQAFARFIEERVMPGCEGTITPTSGSDNIDPNDADVLFFDESVFEKHNRSKFVKKKPTPFLDDLSSHKRTTFVAPSPDASNLPQNIFKYDVWPVPLNPSLFSEPRFVKSLLRSDNGRRREVQQTKKGFVRAGLFERRSSNSNLPNLISHRYVHTVWFSLLTAICTSKRKSKLLASAFSVLDRVRNNGIPIDQQCYRELIQACGKCKSPELALVFLEHMQRDGIIPDASIYSALFTAFSTNGDLSHAYHTLGTLGRIKKTNIPSPDSDAAKSPLSNSWRREKTSAPPVLDEAECKLRFEAASSGLKIVTTETCPHCSQPVSDEAIRHGWKVDSNDYTTACPSCETRFVPRFCISKSDGTDQVFCEYLSPPVLQKEIDTLVRDYQGAAGDYITSRTFLLKSPTVFWNLFWHLTNCSLPISHLVPWMNNNSPTETNGPRPSRARAASELSDQRSQKTVGSSRHSVHSPPPLRLQNLVNLNDDKVQDTNTELP